jgi:hypothetical protein
MGWREALQRSENKRAQCLNSNDHKCNICENQFASGQLVTIPDADACFCIGCWLTGEYKNWGAG